MKSTILILLTLVGSVAAGPDAAAGQSEPAGTSIATVYNDGVALYRDSEYTQAAVMFQQAASAADNSLAAKARYNLGNTHYARALQALQPPAQPDSTSQGASSQDLFAPPAYQGISPELKQAAIEHLQSAISQYRSALRIQPDDRDARANIELANRLIQQLKQEQQQDQQQQDQQQNADPEQSESQKPDSESEQPASEKSEQQQDQSQSDQDASEQSPDQPPTPDESENSQPDDSRPQSERRDTSEENDSAEPPDQPPPAGGQEQQDDQNRDGSSGELTALNESEGDSKEQPMAPLEESMQMTEQEARKMLQAIRDRDMLRRLRRQAAERSRRIPVDRDW